MMQELYTEKDIEKISSQLKKRYLLLGAGMAVLLAVFVFSMIVRWEWLSIGSLFLFFALAVFVIELCCLPLHRYRKLMTAALTGRTHTETLQFERLEEDPSMVDGVRCLGMIFLGAPGRHGEQEQRFYWDSELPLPGFTAGDIITLKYTGRNIIGYEIPS